jgi:PKD domain
VPPRPCAFFYEVVGKLATTIVDVWTWVASVVQRCAANRCTWWCLCCDRWGCWIGMVLLGIVLTVVLVIFILMAVLMVVVCWIVCVIAAILEALGRGTVPNCFAGTPAPPPPANRAPTAVTDGPYNGRVGQMIAMSAATSTDPEGTPLTASWTLGDGTTLTGLTISHTYSNVGVFTVNVTVSDGSLTSTATTTATIVGVGGGPIDEPPIE